MAFLSTTRYSPSSNPDPHPPLLPFTFTGGLSFPPLTVGFAMAILGVIGVIMQLALYPPVSASLGLLRSLRTFLPLFPIAYFLAPYLALIPESAPAALWFAISAVLLLQVTAQTFALPASIILLNNCSPHPSVLGSVHGVGQSVVALSKTLGSVLAGRWFALGLENGVVGTAWWAVAAVSVLGWGVSWWVRDGSEDEKAVLDAREA